MTQLIETRWRKHGKDRVYLKTSDGEQVGHVDLVARNVVAAIDGYEDELADCLARWTDGDVSPEVQPSGRADALNATGQSSETEPGDSTAAREGDDLAANVAGAAAWAKRDEVNARAPVLNFLARLIGLRTEERAWRVGAKGEEMVGAELQHLGPGWRVLHAVPVGDRGSDIDHVVIGRAGVFTLNSKRHPRGKAWVGEFQIRVNGQPTDYLRNSRHEAQRAARLLSTAFGRPVEVTSAVVFVDLAHFTVKQMPVDVHVITRIRLVKWLRSLPVVLDDEAADEVFATARWASTWK